jgi:Bacterial antitoxin of type II TA system, VapB
MVTNMKTTIDIADQLLAEAKVTAAAEGTTVRSLVEEGLRMAIARRLQAKDFRLRPASFHGDGLRPNVSLEHWDEIRTLIYGGHGG